MIGPIHRSPIVSCLKRFLAYMVVTNSQLILMAHSGTSVTGDWQNRQALFQLIRAAIQLHSYGIRSAFSTLTAFLNIPTVFQLHSSCIRELIHSECARIV